MAVSDYYLLNYIQSSGTQWIDTQYYTNPNTKIETRFQYTTATNDTRIVGVNDGSSSNVNVVLYIRGYTDHFSYRYGSRGYGPIDPNEKKHLKDTNIHTWYIQPGKITFDSSTYSFSNTYRGTAIAPLGAFGQTGTDGSVVGYSKGRMWYLKLWTGDDLIRDFVPAIRISDNNTGLYDLQQNTFHPSKTSTIFTYGAILSYNLTLDTMTGGSVEGEGLVNINPDGVARYTAIATPSSGYRFVGWYSDSDRTNLVSSNSSYQGTMTSNTTLYAKFVKTYTITLSSDSSTFGSTTGAGTYDTGSSITIVANLSTPVSVFLGWYNGSTLISTSKSYTFTLTGDVSYKARFVSIKQIGIKIAR